MFQKLILTCACLLSVCAVLSATEEKQPELFLQTGHSSMITSVAWSPDGRTIATSSGDRSVRLWNAATGIELRRLFGHSQMVLSAAFSPDGKQLLTGSLDKTARLWDTATGKELRRFECESLMVPAVVFSPDGKQVLTACYANPPDFTQGTARLWDAATGKLLQTYRGHDSYVTSAVFSPDGQQVLTGSHDKTARLWEAATGKEIRRFSGHTGPIRSVAFTADGKLAASGADDKTARQWDLATGKEVQRFTPPGLLVSSVLVMPDARHAGTGPLDGSADLWDIATGKKLCHLKGHTGIVSSGAFSPDNRCVVTGSLDATARIWDIATGRELHRLQSQCGEVAVAAFSPDGKQILTGGKDGVARLWDAASGQELRQCTGHTAPITSAAFSRDGRQAVTASGGYMTKDHTARLWDLATGKELQCFLGHTDSINSVAISPDGRQVLTGSNDNTVRLWDTATGRVIRRFEGHTQRVGGVAFSADGAQVLSGSWDTTARLWDTATGREIRRFETMMSPRQKPASPKSSDAEAAEDKQAAATPDTPGMAHLIQAVAFAPDGKSILTGGLDWTVRQFAIATGEEVRRFEADFDPNDLVGTGIASVAFSPDGKHILTAAGDGRIEVWDVATGMEMRCLDPRAGAVGSAAFSPDGNQMITAGDDGMTRIWDAATGRELARIIGLRQGADWVVVTPEGYFDGSLDGRQLVMWRIGGKLFPLESYERKFHRPDLVAKALRGEPIEDQPSLPTDRTPPKVGLQVDETSPENATVKVTADAGSPTASIVGIRMTVDGRDISPKRGAGIVRKRTADGRVVFHATVDFPPGKQDALVAAMVTDDFGLQNDPVQLLVRRPVTATPTPTALYVLAVGVSRYQSAQQNLGFCHADAEDLAALFLRQQGRAFAKVHTRVCTNEEATTANVLAGLNWLQQSCTRADVVVVLFSGHGCLNADGLYYLTHEADLDDLNHTALGWEDIAQSLKAISARQVLFLSDCCHAGAFGRPTATQDQLAESLVNDAGVMVFASSRGNEKSAERGEWGHGAFVRALLDGLDGRADLIADGQINISELQTYVVDRVCRLTDDCQHPFIPRLERFDPGLVLARTR